MKILHSDPEFTGTVIANTVEYEFIDGVADVDDLRADHAAALGQIGWSIEVDGEPTPPASVVQPDPQLVVYELGSDIPESAMETPEPELGGA